MKRGSEDNIDPTVPKVVVRGRTSDRGGAPKARVSFDNFNQLSRVRVDDPENLPFWLELDVPYPPKNDPGTKTVVVAVHNGQTITVKRVEKSYKVTQELVGGLIETVPHKETDEHAAWTAYVNENGMAENLPVNDDGKNTLRNVGFLVWDKPSRPIYGPVVFYGPTDEHGEHLSLTPKKVFQLANASTAILKCDKDFSF